MLCSLVFFWKINFSSEFIQIVFHVIRESMWRTIFGIKKIEQKEQNEIQKHNELDTNDWNGKGEAKWKVWAATEKKRMPTTAMISATKPEKNSQIPAKKKQQQQ